jgi:hypothetical protein
MERESFEDPEIARLLNDHFVCIKVDREERPDIDSMYMAVCQMMTGSGGWPLTIVMTPDKRPFFAGTYFPKDSRFGKVGMRELVPQLSGAWTHRKDEVLSSAAKVTQVLQASVQASPGQELGPEDLAATYTQLARNFDRRYGGFGNAPKFPSPHLLFFLLRYWRRTGDEDALHIVDKTLSAMQQGGVYDHVGFGFHRYSTDSRWLVPHFEKMLYDQALLAMVYTEGYQAMGGKREFGTVVHRIVQYVLRDMTSPEGGFYSAEDADSEGEEGKFYLWDFGEIETILGSNDARLFARVFNVLPEGNFRDEVAQTVTGRNILHLTRPVAAVALELGMPAAELERRVDRMRTRLFDYREKRIRPHRDDKILADWNGLMIAALAKAATVLGEPTYADTAARAAEFIFCVMQRPDGRLSHRYRDGEAAVPAFLDDYAFVTWGMLELYHATFQEAYLHRALDLTTILLERFWDAANGAFYFADADADDLLVRKKEIYDGAIPSGNSVALLNLLRLARITGDTALDGYAAKLIRSVSNSVTSHHQAHTFFMTAVDFAVGPGHEIVIVGDSRKADTRNMIAALWKAFLPTTVMLLKPAEEESPEIAGLAEFTRDLVMQDGRATAYVCREYRCELPVTDVMAMMGLLSE